MENGKTTRFRVQAGALIFEIDGSEAFVQQQIEAHRENIETILSEQVKLIRSGNIPLQVTRGRRGRPAKGRRAAGTGRRPGRQPVIIRESSLELKPRQIQKLQKFLDGLSSLGPLGKDAAVFAIAYYLCKEVLNTDTFTAGDISAAYHQLGDTPTVPPAATVDVVQMLRNLAASSIGKEWVVRNTDGTFSLTEKGNEVGAGGAIVRPRGRRPLEPRQPETEAGAAGRPGRPRKSSSSEGEDAREPRRGGKAPGGASGASTGRSRGAKS